MKKLLVIFCILIFFTLGLFVVLSGPFIGKGIKEAVLFSVPQFTESEVELEKVYISLFSGKISLQNLELKNPKGFKQEKAFSINTAEIDIDMRSLFTKHIIIERIQILEPDIVFEKTSTNSNFEAIASNVQNTTQGITYAPEAPRSIAKPIEKETRTKAPIDNTNMESSSSSSPREETVLKETSRSEKISDYFSKIKISINELIIEGATGKVSISKLNLPAKLDRIEAHNIGSQEGGLPPEELLEELLRIISSEVNL